MVSANKILTVSYGTFSCTLEGFDEPFSTMKAIAEYFRDLAADDRYFGAEPPTPDAEMLHRIAEREIQRRVEAKVQTNGVVLRASDLSEAGQNSAAQALTPLSSVAARQTGAQATEPARTAQNTDTAPREQPTAQRAEPEDVIDDFAQDRVAAKLLRIRAAVGQPEPATSAAPDTRAADDEQAKADARADADAEAERADQAARAKAQAEADAKAEADRIAAERAQEKARLKAAREAEEAARQAEAEETARRAEAAQREEEARASEQVRQEADAREAEAAERDADATEPDANEDDADQLLQARILDISRAQTLDAADADADAGGDLVAASADDRPATDDTASSDAPDVAPDSETPDTTVPEVAADTSAPDLDDEDENTPEPQVDAATTDDEPEADDAIDDIVSGTLPETTDPALTRVAQAVGKTSLSPEDEADLFKELAGVESATETSDAEDDGRNLLASAAESEEAAMSRLMKQAETELSGPENRRRLSAIEHLRAAVVATRAERQDPQARPDDSTDRTLGQFQDDLADVVRPRRPATGTRGAAKRPAAPAERIAPLILVSEQRIDKGDAPQRTIRPTRPRRLNTGNLALDDDAEEEDYVSPAASNLMSSDASFPQFVARIGATDLSDLLEAAAVYCAQVEGRHSFSRPQLLRMLGELPDSTDISREEGLRTFGRLLRDGRITKVRRGQFAVKDGSRYLPEARRIAEG